MSGLNLHNVHVQVEDKPILHGISLSIRPGEIHAVMGPNGSGKSTLAYSLAGHPNYHITANSKMSLDGTDLLPLSPDARARLGLFLAFQSPVEITGVTVQNFLRSAWEARFGNIGKTAKNSRFSSVLEFRQYLQKKAQDLQIDPTFLTRNVNEGFSGGERKRLEVLQMKILEPKYAILDETDSGLDIDALKTIAAGVRQVVSQHQTGLLVITHYQRLLHFLRPDFVHVMINGKIEESGGPELAQQLEASGYQRYGEEKV
jgi:Fe-S cluster assembly ATP-binding protein